jgi:hypothetical protein
VIAQLLARLLLLTATVVISILTFIYGWGLQPKSWGWIIGCGFLGNLMVIGFSLALDKEKDK